VITNERQYRITKAQLLKLKQAIDSFDMKKVEAQTRSQVLAKAELEALESQYQDLFDEIQEYEALKSGTVSILKAKSLHELPELLIKARIAKGLSQHELADNLGVKEQQIQRYEAEKYASASLRRLAEIAAALDLKISEIAEFEGVSAIRKQGKAVDIIWEEFPVDEMYKRHWFEGFQGSLEDARANAEALVRGFIDRAGMKPAAVLYRKHIRAGLVPDPYALLSWQCRVRIVAMKYPLANKYRSSQIDSAWLEQLAQISRHKDGPTIAKDHLEKAGIHFVLEPHLTHTHLDGAAILLPDGSPLVVLTLRYDRSDNFWFVLFHEVIHVIKHLKKAQVDGFFDDLDAEADAIEQEADQIAGDLLLPPNVWETALARYVRTAESVNDLAKQLRINPAIIAGRIRKEANNYAILADLVGSGGVRRLFPEVNFGQ